MTKLNRIFAAGAVIAAIAVPAVQASAATKTESALIGAAFGALAGSLLGHGDTGAVVAGAAVGGIVGASAGNNHRIAQPTYRGDYRTSYRPQPTRWAPTYRDYRYDRGYAPVSYRTYGY